MFGSLLSTAVAFPVCFKAVCAPHRVCEKSPSSLFGWPTFQFLQSIMTRTYWTCHQCCFFPIHLFLLFQLFPLSSGKSFQGGDEDTACIVIHVLPPFVSNLHNIVKCAWTHCPCIFLILLVWACSELGHFCPIQNAKQNYFDISVLLRKAVSSFNMAVSPCTKWDPWRNCFGS